MLCLSLRLSGFEPTYKMKYVADMRLCAVFEAGVRWWKGQALDWTEGQKAIGIEGRGEGGGSGGGPESRRRACKQWHTFVL